MLLTQLPLQQLRCLSLSYSPVMGSGIIQSTVILLRSLVVLRRALLENRHRLAVTLVARVSWRITEENNSPISKVNLRVGSMTVSKWLTFGHVLFSPAREAIVQSEGSKRYSILVIDGLGNGMIPHPPAIMEDTNKAQMTGLSMPRKRIPHQLSTTSLLRARSQRPSDSQHLPPSH